ncbi:MAG: PocR ligand-binding domain-containing protein, partial [Planctomycetota bacterium]|nr:PocR ligand-binding domain-containing protein [Planctomycetota bacterium]
MTASVPPTDPRSPAATGPASPQTQPPAQPSAQTPAATGHVAPPHPHKLTEFLDAEGLQELQDSFTGMTGLQMRILGPTGEPLTKPTDARARHSGDVI